MVSFTMHGVGVSDAVVGSWAWFAKFGTEVTAEDASDGICVSGSTVTVLSVVTLTVVNVVCDELPPLAVERSIDDTDLLFNALLLSGRLVCVSSELHLLAVLLAASSNNRRRSASHAQSNKSPVPMQTHLVIFVLRVRTVR